jgi:hypothetical protein
VLAAQAERASGEEQARLYAQAGEKYRAALAIRPDDYEALAHWALVLMAQARNTSGKERGRLLDEVEAKLLYARKLGAPQSYNLACVLALRGKSNQCRDALRVAEDEGDLPSVDHLLSDADLESVRDKPWFRRLVARLSSKAA